MTWNPPTVSTLPPPVAPTPPPQRPVETPAERRARSAATAAAWIGLLGAALVLIAAAVVLTRSWPGYGELIRAVALVAGSGLATLIAERFRRSVPVTASIGAHVGAFMAGAAGIAATSLFGVEWPLCLVVGGLAAAAATQVQSRRWAPAGGSPPRARSRRATGGRPPPGRAGASGPRRRPTSRATRCALPR